ncbi:MAG: methyltransferase [Chloroflexota bacterium]
MSSQQTDFQRDLIDRLAQSVYLPFAMLAGMQLDLFTPLQHGPLTAEELAVALAVKPDKLSLLLYALVNTRLLSVERDEAGIDHFANTPEADYFLVKGKPSYRGSLHEAFSDMWNSALHTAETIRHGQPQAKHDFHSMDPAELAVFFRGLHAGATATARALMRRYDMKLHRSLLDVGGGSGGLAISLVNALPALHATVAELPSVTSITQQFIDEAGVGERVTALTIDVAKDAFSGDTTYDAAVMLNYTQILSIADIRSSLQHVYEVLDPGGVLYIVAAVLDDERTTPIETVGMNLVFLNIYDDGRAYTDGEYRSWLAEAGFVDYERMSRVGVTASFIRVCKPG